MIKILYGEVKTAVKDFLPFIFSLLRGNRIAEETVAGNTTMAEGLRYAFLFIPRPLAISIRWSISP